MEICNLLKSLFLQEEKCGGSVVYVGTNGKQLLVAAVMVQAVQNVQTKRRNKAAKTERNEILSVFAILQKICVILNRLFDSLWFDADVTLRGGGTAVLQEPLDKGDVIAVCLVDLCCVPFAKTVGANSLVTQIVADDP